MTSATEPSVVTIARVCARTLKPDSSPKLQAATAATAPTAATLAVVMLN